MSEIKATSTTVHDIRNQLSSISLALEQLKYDMPEQNDDCDMYISMISDSCKTINSLLADL
jgi:signal transduction histidine kinase